MEDLHLFRVGGTELDPNIGEENITAHYKADIRIGGYKPSPVYQGELSYLHWTKYFKHPNPDAGGIESVTAYPQDKVPFTDYSKSNK